MKQLVIGFILAATAAIPLFAADKPKRSGDEVYRVYCASCHSGGWQGAPVAYDEREWTDRMAQGMERMFDNAKKGLNGMPPMGTCMDCSDEELKAAVDEMLRF